MVINNYAKIKVGVHIVIINVALLPFMMMNVQYLTDLSNYVKNKINVLIINQVKNVQKHLPLAMIVLCLMDIKKDVIVKRNASSKYGNGIIMKHIFNAKIVPIKTEKKTIIKHKFTFFKYPYF